MSKNNAKHNYSKYSSNNQKKPAEVKEVAPEVPAATEEPKVDVAPAPVVQEAVVEQMRFIPVEGTVIDCAKLNVRNRPAPGASVVTTIDVDTRVEIDTKKSTNDWVHVRTADGVEGYCMRKYIKADL